MRNIDKELQEIAEFVKEELELYPKTPTGVGSAAQIGEDLLKQRQKEFEKKEDIKNPEEIVPPTIKVDDVSKIKEWLEESNYPTYLNDALLDVTFGNIIAEEAAPIDHLFESDMVVSEDESTDYINETLDKLLVAKSNKDNISLNNILSEIDSLVEDKEIEAQVDSLIEEINNILNSHEDEIFKEIDDLTSALESEYITKEHDDIDKLIEEISKDIDETISIIEQEDSEEMDENPDEENDEEEEEAEEDLEDMLDSMDDEEEKEETVEEQENVENEIKKVETKDKDPVDPVEEVKNGDNERVVQEDDVVNVNNDTEVAPTEVKVDGDAEKAEASPKPETVQLPVDQQTEKQELNIPVSETKIMDPSAIATKALKSLMEQENREDNNLEIIKEIVLGRK